jgi:peptidoglycan/LPS O-acetylase OafA/YrhL
LYVVALLVALVGIPVMLPAHAADVLGEAPRALVWLWTYTLNIANAFGWVVSVGVLGQMWSLAIEEQFYAVWPWVVRQLDARRLAWACAVLVVGALLLRLAWIDAEGLAAWPGPYRFTLTRVDALAAGAVLAVAWRAPAAAPWIAAAARVGLIASGGVLLAWFVWAPRFYPDQPGVVTVGHTVLAIASSCLVARGLLSPPRWMSWRLLRALGTYSYGVYVWHWFVQYPMVLFADGLHPAIFVACGVSASLLLGVVSYHVLERPFLRLKHAFDYVGSSRPVAVDAG